MAKSVTKPKPPALDMTIKTKISFREYVKLLYGLAYRKPLMIVILCVDLVMICWITGYYARILPLPKPLIYQYITVFLITIVQPSVIYLTIWHNYHSSNHLREPLEIGLTQAQVKIKGDTFYTEIHWEKMFRVDELNKWFLIYQNNLSAIILPKKDFTAVQLQGFKKILRSLPSVPVNLKKES